MRGIPTEKQHIDITLTRLGAHIVLRVRDYGTGLTEVEQARLFEPFYTDKATGLGLGLSISYNIVEAHGGTLTASPPGHGHGSSEARRVGTERVSTCRSRWSPYH